MKNEFCIECIEVVVVAAIGVLLACLLGSIEGIIKWLF